MSLISKILIALIALEHLYILYIEIFAWTSKGNKIVSHSDNHFYTLTKSMAANQGLYNAFMVAGLVWSLFISDPIWSHHIGLFFSGCILIAGVFGSLTASKSIFFKQGLPALIAVITLLIL